MIKEIVKVKLSDELKSEVMELIEDTIYNVMDIHSETIDKRTVSKIRNLALDQINVNITNRANLKTLWVLNIEDSIPLLIEKEAGIPDLGALIKDNAVMGLYKMRPNLTWTYNRDNASDGLSKEEFEVRVREMLLEDVETAAFYGALSYVGDNDE